MPLQIKDIIDLQTLVESEQVEFKLAGGKDGKGELPKDFWPTYSAMANGRGGWVVLGVKEQAGKFIPVGIVDPEKIKADLFNQLNDRDRVSANVLRSENDVQQVSLQGTDVLAIHIPQAMRKQKPVHLKKSPFGNTYQRLHEGDRVCDDMTVKRMLAEQIHDSRDNEVLSEHYTFQDDIDLDSLKVYRNLLSANNPQHPYLACEPFELFKMVGGWRKDRETGKKGLRWLAFSCLENGMRLLPQRLTTWWIIRNAPKLKQNYAGWIGYARTVHGQGTCLIFIARYTKSWSPILKSPLRLKRVSAERIRQYISHCVKRWSTRWSMLILPIGFLF